MTTETELTLDEKRQAAFDANECHTKTYLKNVLRLKPKNLDDYEYTYVNDYKTECRVYSVKKCVPMRERKPSKRTKKQEQATKQLVFATKMKSNRGSLSRWAQKLLTSDIILFDTETTGLDGHDQIVQIAVIDAEGNTLLNTLVHTDAEIAPEAANVHGITKNELKNAPLWRDVWGQLQTIFHDKTVIAFNNGFDIRMLRQTCEHNNVEYKATWFSTDCAMELAADFLGYKNGYVSLSCAMAELRASWEGEAHEALTDSRAALEVIRRIADYENRVKQRLGIA